MYASLSREAPLAGALQQHAAKGSRLGCSNPWSVENLLTSTLNASGVRAFAVEAAAAANPVVSLLAGRALPLKTLSSAGAPGRG